MKILGLDISTKTGYAVINDGVLLLKGLLKSEAIQIPEVVEDFSQHRRACHMANQIWTLIKEQNPDMIFIEQTNLGKSRTDQKGLEFVHCLVLHTLAIQSTPDKDYTKMVRYIDTSRWRSILKIKLSSEQRSHNRLVKAGAARGKVTPKHLAVAWANETYGLELLKKDHDIADAIALATFGQRNPSEPVSVEFDLDSIIEPHKKVVV